MDARLAGLQSAPAARGVDSQQAFERKGRASLSPLWSECDGSKKTMDLSATSFEQRRYSVGPSTGASPCNGRSPIPPRTTASTTLRSLETSRITGPPWRALPAELCTLKPQPLASKGLEVKMRPAPSNSLAPSNSPAPSEFPAPQSTYVSPPMIFAQPRPWTPEQGADGYHATPSFTLNVYRGTSL